MSGLNFPSDSCDGDHNYPETDPTAVINYESELSLLLENVPPDSNESASCSSSLLNLAPSLVRGETSTTILHGLETVPECCYEDGAKDRASTGGHKRIRSTQLHNLNERLRRQKLKEKMKALQELVPNCNKRDKSSTLDDVIKYIKTLQYQLQMMSTGAGYTMFNSPMISQSDHPISSVLDPGPMIGMGRACSSSLFGYPTSPLGPSISQLHIPTSFSLSLPSSMGLDPSESQGIPNQSCTINEQCIKGVLPSQIILPDVEDNGCSHLSSTTWPSSGT